MGLFLSVFLLSEAWVRRAGWLIEYQPSFESAPSPSKGSVCRSQDGFRGAQPRTPSPSFSAFLFSHLKGVQVLMLWSVSRCHVLAVLGHANENTEGSCLLCGCERPECGPIQVLRQVLKYTNRNVCMSSMYPHWHGPILEGIGTSPPLPLPLVLPFLYPSSPLSPSPPHPQCLSMAGSLRSHTVWSSEAHTPQVYIPVLACLRDCVVANPSFLLRHHSPRLL